MMHAPFSDRLLLVLTTALVVRFTNASSSNQIDRISAAALAARVTEESLASQTKPHQRILDTLSPNYNKKTNI